MARHCVRWLVGLAAILGASGWAPGKAQDQLQLTIPLGLIEPDLPLDRPFTRELVALGQKLFFERRLSRSGYTSCATCHDPAVAFADPRPVSISDNGLHQRRNAPSLLNAGFWPTTMWDGRFRTLEQQVRDPFRRQGDMGLELGDAMAVLVADPGYRDAFQAATGALPSTDGMATALAAYQRSLVSGNTPFDRYLFAGEKNALSPLAKLGLELFAGRASCINCHDIFHPIFNPLGGGVALFTDFRFHNIGVGYRAGQMNDVGRYYATRAAEDWGAFRTPSLRNVALTAPYMHDGSLATMAEVIELYNRGGNPNPNLSPTLRPLYLNLLEKEALIAFLQSLTDPGVANMTRTTPPQPRF